MPNKNPNELSRIELGLALAETGSITIDRFTGVKGYGALPQDRAVREGKTYSDKAPGLSFLSVPVLLAIQHVLPSVAESRLPTYWPLRHVLTGLLVALPAALLPFLLLRTDPPVDHRLRLSLAVLFALTTPMLTYATVFFGHVPAAILTTVAFVLLLGPGRPEYVPSPRAALAGGVLAGYSVVTEYPTAVTGVVLFVSLLLRRPPGRVLLSFAVGGLLGVLPVLVYHHVAFGAPWATGYAFKGDVKHAAVHAQGLMGIAFPTGERLWGVLFGAARGVLYYCPLLLLVPVGWVVIARRSRREVWPLVLLTTGYLFMAAGFVDWKGGWCAAARHVTPALPLCALPVAEAIEVLRRRLGSMTLVVVLTGMSACAAILSIVVTPFFPPAFPAPLAQVTMRSFWEGAAWPNLLSEWAGVAPRGVAVGFAVVVMVLVAGALVRLVPPGRAKGWVPSSLLLTAVLHAWLVWSAAPWPTPQQEAMRALVLERLGYAELATRVHRGAQPTASSRPTR